MLSNSLKFVHSCTALPALTYCLPQLRLDNDQLLILLSFSLIIMPQPLPDNVKPPLLQPDNAHLALRLGLEKKKTLTYVRTYVYVVAR